LLSSEHAVNFVGWQRGSGAVLDHLRDAHFQLDLIDFWAWGNEHYAAFHEATPDTGITFHSACIGHGGYPFTRVSRPHGVPQLRWLEEETRFPSAINVRPELGNNGFCMAKLTDRTLELRFIDWLDDERCVVELPRNADGTLGRPTVTPRPRPGPSVTWS
jgi:hypothetical protein